MSTTETYAGEALGIDWPTGRAPHRIGRALVLKLNVKRGWYHRPPARYQEIPEAPAHRGAGLSVAWRRLPSEHEQRTCDGAHVYDRSAAYLAACSSADLPYGAPAWVPGARCIKEQGIGWRAGLWHVHVEHAISPSKPSPFDGHHLPAVCGEGEQWLWTPILRAAVECGYHVAPGDGAILWFDAEGGRGQHRVLGTWQKHVWQARRALETDEGARWPDATARREAVALVKQVYTRTIGIFGHQLVEQEVTGEEIEAGAEVDHELPRWHRPEWQRTIEAEAVGRAFYAMRKAYGLGMVPLWAHIDTLAFAAGDNPSIVAEAAGLFVNPDSCGAWRYEYTMPMQELLNPKGRNVNGHKLPGVMR